MSKVEGMDVSTFQGKIDWDQVKASGKVDFCPDPGGIWKRFDGAGRRTVRAQCDRMRPGRHSVGRVSVQLCRDPGTGGEVKRPISCG